MASGTSDACSSRWANGRPARSAARSPDHSNSPHGRRSAAEALSPARRGFAQGKHINAAKPNPMPATIRPATYLKSRGVATAQTSKKPTRGRAALPPGLPLLLDRLQQNSSTRCDRNLFVANETIAARFRSKKQATLHAQATVFLPT
jgi:hypothetical protein